MSSPETFYCGVLHQGFTERGTVAIQSRPGGGLRLQVSVGNRTEIEFALYAGQVKQLAALLQKAAE